MAETPEKTDTPTDENETLSEFIRRLPPGKLTKEEIDQQLQEERNSWIER